MDSAHHQCAASKEYCDAHDDNCSHDENDFEYDHEHVAHSRFRSMILRRIGAAQLELKSAHGTSSKGAADRFENNVFLAPGTKGFTLIHKQV